MAARMTRTLGDVNPVLVCIMNGGMVPFGKLLPRLQFPLQVDYVHVTRYRERLKGGDLHWLQGPHLAVRGRAVVLVDDILDEGTTLAAIEDRRPLSQRRRRGRLQGGVDRQEPGAGA
jgi:hypoxanthine phosphoribosyltransferase